ncbi:MAG: phosphate ABC transporter permease PstA [SAR202 cluster bacterium]|mgnify:FL=1|jgi:phosphate transport system permease protein|nr:MAG: phosphate ABC transporter permease PstA [SAR202 cluster bacterium]MCH2530273.1 phosphate ABC transporter permease PstA [Dehalococcoidia bacterium]MDP6960602.1 phosphate ABC transporter permease PstA [Dehalococcoidia bacterium]MQG90523.1 phosphate ABC transporter permease PstA [SAR202 cluster bacterium]GIT17750.1 MAG: phosphate transport system permease protein PstA [Dehalococcoidia bacterium]|tara:strand:- start:2487 stop:3383 length:897 start_codon:yes stop_codon:yes gene_type:complete
MIINSAQGPGGKSKRFELIRTWRDRIFFVGFLLAILIGVAGLAALLIDVLIDGLGFLNWKFLTNYASRKPLESGILAPMAGTVWVVGLTAIFTVPVGIGTAIYLEEFARKNRLTRLIELNISNLAGVPSVIYGLLGLAVFVQFLFNGSRNLTAGALTMTLLILPIVIIASQEAIKAVPSSYRDAAYAMGATRWQVVKTVVMPQAVPGMMSGIILALSRAVGESAPILIISSLVWVTFVPTSPDSKFTVLPLQIFTWVSQPQEDFRSIAAAGIIVLLLILLGMNAVAIWIRNKYQVRSE